MILSANGKPFSTYDRDNDGDEGINCAEESKGGWWFDGCDAGWNGGEIYLNTEFPNCDYEFFFPKSSLKISLQNNS